MSLKNNELEERQEDNSSDISQGIIKMNNEKEVEVDEVSIDITNDSEGDEASAMKDFKSINSSIQSIYSVFCITICYLLLSVFY